MTRAPIQPRTSKNLITALPAEYHLHTHSLDLPAEEIHRSAGADRGDVERLEVIDDLGNGVQTLLHGEHVFVVDGTEEVSGFACCEEIGRVLETNREGVELGPGCEGSWRAIV